MLWSRAPMRRPTSTFLAASFLLAAALPAQAAEVWFNTQPETDLTGEILASLDRNVALADGRPAEFYVNIFAFTERRIGRKLLEVAKNNPNIQIKMVTDWSQLATSGSRQPPFLEMAAAGRYADACNGLERTAAKRTACRADLEALLGGEPLENLQIRYKKDDPYRYDAEDGEVIYDHGRTDGLNHHKAIAYVIDGVPTEMMTGSFNWSPTANDSNYENLMRFHRDNPAERALIRAFAAETGAMFHNAAVSLSGPDARAFKTWLHEKHLFDAGEGPNPGPAPAPTTAGDVEVIAICPNPSGNPTLEELVDDVNGAVAVLGADFADEPLNVNNAPISKLVSTLGISNYLARQIAREARVGGGFADAADLRDRVPGAANISGTRFGRVEFGGTTVAVNHATEEDLLVLYGVGPVNARKIVSWIEANGPMESLQDFRKAGVAASTIAKFRNQVDLRYSEAFFSGKFMDCPQPGTGFAAVNATRTTLVADADGSGVTRVPGNLPAPVVDLFRRAKPGDEIKVAAYGFSASSPEYAALKAAVEGGASARIVLNGAYNQGIANTLLALGAANDGRVQVKWFKSRTMHEKFGVNGNDLFNGSANLNPSSTGKHAEERFVVKNDDALAEAFHDEFDRLWELATVPDTNS